MCTFFVRPIGILETLNSYRYASKQLTLCSVRQQSLEPWLHLMMKVKLDVTELDPYILIAGASNKEPAALKGASHSLLKQ